MVEPKKFINFAIMKKITLLILFLSIFICNTFSQEIIEKLTEKSSKEIIKVIKKLPADSKITITFFSYEDNFSDTTKTYLGIKISKYLSQNINLQIKKQNLTYKILFPDDIDGELYDKMKAGFIMPDNISSKDFWNDFLKNNQSDFYITGKYQLNNEIDNIKLINVKIIPNKLGNYQTHSILSVKDTELKIKNIESKNYIKELNQPISNLNKAFWELIHWQGFGKSFEMNLIDTQFKTISNNKLIVGNDYNISIKTEQDAYVYAFYFDPLDKNFPFIFMIYPFQENQDNFISKGTNSIPPNYSFAPDPPAYGQVFVQVFVSEKKIPLKFEYVDIGGGYKAPVLKYNNCKEFLNSLNKIGKKTISTQQAAFFRTIK